MFKDLKEGQTHSENDGCGEPAHNMSQKQNKECYKNKDGLCYRKNCDCLIKPEKVTDVTTQKPADWETMLEYALPDTLTDDEKRIIKNNVESILESKKPAEVCANCKRNPCLDECVANKPADRKECSRCGCSDILPDASCLYDKTCWCHPVNHPMKCPCSYHKAPNTLKESWEDDFYKKWDDNFFGLHPKPQILKVYIKSLISQTREEEAERQYQLFHNTLKKTTYNKEIRAEVLGEVRNWAKKNRWSFVKEEVRRDCDYLVDENGLNNFIEKLLKESLK